MGTPFASTAHYSLLAALAQNQLSASDVRLVDLQPQAILAAWERGDIDAACTWLPTLDDPDAAAKAIAAEIGLKPEDVAGQLPRDCPVPSRSDERAVRGGVRIHNVEHRYGSGKDQVTALGPVDLDVEPGAFLVLVGASGCGKSTLLRLIAGSESPTEGQVQVAGSEPTPGVSAGVVFQQPRLFPWRTVGGNVELALKYAEVPRERRAERRDELLHRVGLDGTADRRIWEISGGQHLRVAIARALAAETPLFLLDEPFAALDALTRERLQEDVRQVSAESGRTTVFVTHSADEAAFLGSRIVVLARAGCAGPARGPAARRGRRRGVAPLARVRSAARGGRSRGQGGGLTQATTRRARPSGRRIGDFTNSWRASRAAQG
ncbi:MAG: taurine transport system ATP-binding protein [Mycobacterium sp.]|nr:taurine transport system ATP-binding protein [Mycobacterium sp.]